MPTRGAGSTRVQILHCRGELKTKVVVSSSSVESTSGQMTKSDEQLEMQENRKNRVNELVVKLDELVKSDKRWKGCGLPEKYKHFLINYMDSHILGKYEIFANFDQSLESIDIRTERASQLYWKTPQSL